VRRSHLSHVGLLVGALVIAWFPSGWALGSATPACGKWTVVPSPNAGTNASVLSGVSASSQTNAWAVGNWFTGQVNRTLAMRWNGSRWSIVRTPNANGRTNSLTSVAVIGPNDAWAAGFYDDGSTFRTLAMHWNGLSWSIVATPNVGTGENALLSVSVAGSGDVWAVGYAEDFPSSPRQTLALHWSGGPWQVVSTPDVGTDENILWAVRGRTSQDIWAVGAYSVPWFQTLVEHWDGASWTVVASPNLGNGDNVLYSAVVSSASSAMTVGTWLDGNQQATLAQRWDGTSWSVVPTPSPAGSLNFLLGAAESGPSDIWAVGWGPAQPFGASRNLAEHWDGTAWTVAHAPNVGTGSNQLAAVANVVDTAAFWAVGQYEQGGLVRTLTEFRC
jgi:hypothetical protein